MHIILSVEYLLDLDEIKAQLEGIQGVEELQKEINRRKTRVSESQSDTGSNADKISLTGSLKRYFVFLSFPYHFCYLNNL